MDNLTHTLFGLTLARTPLGRAGRGTTAALILASSAPDIDIIAAGTSRAQREAARTLLEIIRQLDGGAGVTEEDIIARATSEGIEESRARSMLGRLSEQGQIYAPDRRHYKVASR